MKKYLLLPAILLLFARSLFAQGYFTDRNGNGSPVFLKDGGKNTMLFSANIDVSDQSNLKANFYRQYWLNKKSYKTDDWFRSKHFIGWGINFKGGTVNGTGSLFQSGSFTPGFTGGAYITYTHMNWRKDKGLNTHFSVWALILSGSTYYSTVQFFDSTKPFDQQLSAQTFQGNKFTLAAVWRPSSKSNDFYLGASVSGQRANNYSSLDLVTIQDNSTINGTGVVRNISSANSGDNTYAIGNYREYNNFDARLSATFVPESLANFAFTLYPSLDLSSVYAPMYNVGVAVSYLKSGNPSIAVASIFFELNDLNNAAGSDDPFMKRSFKIGISSALNLLNGDK